MDSGGYNPSNSFIAPDLKRRQLLFDSFAKLQQKTSSDTNSVPLTQPVLPSSNQSARPAQTSASASTDASTNQSITQNDSLLVTDGAKGTLLYGWGAGYHGQLGLNTARKKCRLQPACIDFHEPSVMVACGGFHTAVLTDDGRVYTWGDGRLGQLGNLARKHNMHSTPRLVDYLVTYKVSISYIACGQYHTAALSNQGRLYTWGSGKWGQLGHGVRQDERFPRKVETEKSIGNLVKVACGDRHTAVLNDAGAVITFGNGQHGQLGHGNGLDCLRPTIISSGELSTQKVVALDCGATTTAAVTESGSLYLWGFGESLHPKGVSNVLESPREVKIKAAVKSVACGLGHVLVLTTQGDVYSFGVAGMGQIGHGTKNSVRTPRCILKGKEIHQIAAGRYHSMAVSNYGIVYSWGCSESGQTGVNLNLENEYLPRIIDNLLANVVGHIACGEHHSLALTSISHSTVNTDVQQWKLIEDSELELKRAWLKDNLNGLKTKHILAIEEARPAMIDALAHSIKHEREEKNKAARSKIALLTDITGISNQSMNQSSEPDYDEVQMETERDYNDGALSAAAIRAIEATAARLANTGTLDTNQSINRNDDDDEEEAAAKRRRTKRLAALMNSADAQSSAQSAAVTPRGTQSINPSINPDISHEEKESMVVYQSPSHSRPSSTVENRVRFPPLQNRQSLNQSTNQSNPAAGEIGFAPLAPRISFIESTTKTLVKVKSFMSNTVIPAEGNYVDELISVKKQYNALKSARLRLEKQQQTKAHELSLCAPNAEEVASARVQNDALKALNMKLVTLNTRLMEAEENKKNYELYIIRMKEEDLQLGKQIDHLRSICGEYSRLLNKLEKMNQRVAAQKLEVVDETHHLVDDVHKFISFADSVVSDYRRVLQASYRQSCYQEQLLNQRAARVDSKRQAKIDQLREDMRDLTQTHGQVKADIDEWENKVEYYERRFRKVAAATGLTRADEIISKFYFNDEITKDLTNEIASKQGQLDVLNQSMKQLSDELTASQESLSVSKWKDVSSSESRLAEAKLLHQRSQEEADKWTNRVTQCIQGMQQLYAQIKHVVPGEDIDQLIVNQPISGSNSQSTEDEDEEDEADVEANDEADDQNTGSADDVAEPSFNDGDDQSFNGDDSLSASQTLDVVLPSLEDAEESESEGEELLDVTQLMNEVAIATAKRIAHLSQPRSEADAQPLNSTTHSALDLTSPPRRPITSSHVTDPLQRATGLTSQSVEQLQAALRAGLTALVEAVEATKAEAAHYHRQRAVQEQQAYEQHTQSVREEQLAAMLINPRKNIWESLHEHVQQATVNEDELSRFNQTIEQSETASASVESRPSTQSTV